MSWRRREIWLSLVIFALTLVVYANSFENSFHYDDSHSIVENPHIRSLANLPAFFLDPGTFSGEPAMAMYRPLLVSSFALNYAVGAYDPWGYLAVNICLHGLVAILVFHVLSRWSGKVWLGFWGGLLFAVHPIHSQTVNYVSSRSVSLSAAGVLLALCLLAFGYRRWWPPLAYAAALLAKSTAVALVPLVALQQRSTLRPVGSIWFQAPFWLVTGVYLWVIWTNGFLPGSLNQDVRPPGVQWATQTKALVYYAKMLLMPVGQSVEHTFHTSHGFSDAPVVAALALLLSVGLFAFRSLNAAVPAATGAAWFVCCMAPTFLIPLNVLVSEHRLYLASVGVLLGVLGTLWLAARRTPLIVPGLLLLVFWSVLSVQRSSVWRDEYALWSDAAGKAPRMFRVQSNLGLAQLNRGETGLAIETLQRALGANPRYGKTWSNLGLALEEIGRLDSAEFAYRRAIQLQPKMAGLHNNLGSLLVRKGAFEEGLKVLHRALEIDSLSLPARTNMGLARQRMGNLRGARSAYEKALELAPGNAEVLNNLGLLLIDMDRPTDAYSALRRALAADPGYEDARINLRSLVLQSQGHGPAEVYEMLTAEFPLRGELWSELGKTYARAGSWERAAAALEEALRLAPATLGVRSQLARAYRLSGRLTQAIEQYELALLEDSRDLGLYDNLASAYAAAGRIDAAIESCRRALSIEPSHERALENLRMLRRGTSALPPAPAGEAR